MSVLTVQIGQIAEATEKALRTRTHHRPDGSIAVQNGDGSWRWRCIDCGVITSSGSPTLAAAIRYHQQGMAARGGDPR